MVVIHAYAEMADKRESRCRAYYRSRRAARVRLYCNFAEDFVKSVIITATIDHAVVYSVYNII